MQKALFRQRCPQTWAHRAGAHDLHLGDPTLGSAFLDIFQVPPDAWGKMGLAVQSKQRTQSPDSSLIARAPTSTLVAHSGSPHPSSSSSACGHTHVDTHTPQVPCTLV